METSTFVVHSGLVLLFFISDHGLYLGKSTIDMEQKRDCQLLETMANAEGEQGRWQ